MLAGQDTRFAPALIRVVDRAGFQQAIQAQRRAGKLKRLRRPPISHVPRTVERSYYRSLTRILDNLLAIVKRNVLQRLAEIVAQAPRELRGDANTEAAGRLEVRHDQFDDAIKSLMGQVKIQFLTETKPAVSMAARSTANQVSEAQDRDHKRAVQSVFGVRPDLAEPWLGPVIDSFVTTNTRLIEDLSETALDGVARRIGDGVRSGFTADTIAEQIVDDLDQIGESITLKRANFIARDQVGSLFGDLARVRNQRLGLHRYTWSTSLDEKVRPAHREREGLVFDWDQPIEPQLREYDLEIPKIAGHVGREPGCRCVGIPLFSDLLEDAPEVMEPREQRERPNLRVVPASPQGIGVPGDEFATVAQGRPFGGEPIPPPPESNPVITTKPQTVSLGDKEITFARDPASKEDKRKLVLVSVAALDAAWQRDLPGFYIPPGGAGEIAGRRAAFERFLETALESGMPIEASRVQFDERLGRISFANGRHRFSVLRDKGLTEIPVAVEPEDVDAVVRAFGARISPR